MKIVTDEMFASVPALIEQGMSRQQIADNFGVTKGSLTVLCSRRGISLRKGGKRPAPPSDMVTWTLPISPDTKRSLRSVAQASGRDTQQLVADLLERIANDGLYLAVLDETLEGATTND